MVLLKKCGQCRIKMAQNYCLFCLYESCKMVACETCHQFTPKACHKKADYLKAALWGQVAGAPDVQPEKHLAQLENQARTPSCGDCALHCHIGTNRLLTGQLWL